MVNNRIRLRVSEAREHAERALAGIGYAEEEVRILADHMIEIDRLYDSLAALHG